MKKLLIISFLLLSTAAQAVPVLAQAPAEISFFYSETCPHCHREALFLDELKLQYREDLVIDAYSVNNPDTREVLLSFAKKYGIEDELGLVPMTFIGDRYFVGFDSSDGNIGTGIIEEIERVLAGKIEQEGTTEESSQQESIELPIVGSIDPSQYSLPVLAIILGALDGFNVCSLGALVLILGLTLQLKSRRKIATYGGVFLVTTALIYGLLISFWYKIFTTVGSQLGFLNLLIGFVGILGGLYFLKEFWRLRKVGMICKTTGASFVDKVTKRAETAFQNPNQVFALILAVIAFAGVIAIVEFPCSAAIPVVFAGVLAEQGITGLGYLSLMGIFLLFYLIDEIIIFAIAAWQLKLVFTSPNLTIWATFIEALLLLGLGSYYLLSVI